MLWFSEVLRLLTASTLHNNAIKVSLDFNNVTVYQQVLAIVSKPADMPDQYIPGTFLVYKLHRLPGTNLLFWPQLSPTAYYNSITHSYAHNTGHYWSI